MKKILFVLILLLFASSAMAAPLFTTPGSELKGWQGNEGDLAWWNVMPNSSVTLVSPGSISNAGVGAIGCNLVNPAFDNHIRQVVDDSLSPLWLSGGTGKIIDLTVDIAHQNWGGYTNSSSQYGVRFRLDWWTINPAVGPGNALDPGGVFATGLTYNNGYVIDPSGTTQISYTSKNGPVKAHAKGNYRYTDWTEYVFQDNVGPQSAWATYNPFNEMYINDCQPRWVSVEIEWLQPAGHMTAIDNIKLTSKCVPEFPAAALAPLGLFAFGFIKRKFAK